MAHRFPTKVLALGAALALILGAMPVATAGVATQQSAL